MKSFTYERATSPEAAAAAAQAKPGAKFIAGGTNLLDLIKLKIETPLHLIEIRQHRATQHGACNRRASMEVSPILKLVCR